MKALAPRRSTAQDTRDRAARAAVHHALADEHRLAIVELLAPGDRTPGEIGERLGLPSNLVAFHLGELERAGIVGRRRSEGDARRRYVQLVADSVAGVDVLPAHLRGATPAATSDGTAPKVLFVCTANQARSPLAAALWRALTGTAAESAGTQPAAAPHPTTRTVAAAHGLDLGGALPRSLDAVTSDVDLVISVCDRAHEDGIDIDAPTLHWSVPDPVGRGRPAFERTLDDLTARIDRLQATTALA